MAAQAGKDFLLQSDDGNGVYTTLGGLKNANMSLNGEVIDITNQGSSQYKESLDGAGIIHMSISGTGVFSNTTNENLARTRFFARSLNNYRITDGINTFTAKCRISKLDRSADYKSEQNYALTLESSGVITVA